MFFALGMREVAALIGVESEAESALVGADVIAHEIGILWDVDGLKDQFSQSLLALNVCILVTGHSHVTDSSAGTVLPVYHYIRVYKMRWRCEDWSMKINLWEVTRFLLTRRLFPAVISWAEPCL